jgi:sigma-54 dependent transcriptional regulator, flagellar regulatory protein
MDVTRAEGPVGAESASSRAGLAAVPHVYPDGLVCSPSSPLVEVRRTCLRVAASQATVLLTGETGTGKEVFARLIHTHSPRAKRPFVPVNCGAIPEALLESELFGYVRGAFTGAVHPRKGRVALADGGTLFLDEVGELPLSLQVKLLRLLQQRTYEPVGSSDSVTADFRLVAATNRDLLQEVRGGRYRQDLYYRLNVCPVHLPPLRQRRGDVSVLFQHFWRARGEVRPVEPEVLTRLERHDWQGNVRELENLVERVSVIAEGSVIRVQDLPSPLFDEPAEPEGHGLVALSGGAAPLPPEPPSPSPAPLTLPLQAHAAPSAAPLVASPRPPMSIVASALPPPLTGWSAEPDLPAAVELTPPPLVTGSPVVGAASLALPVNLPALLRELEEAYIAKALAQTGGNKKEAAQLLGMGRTTLVEKLRRRNADTSAS